MALPLIPVLKILALGSLKIVFLLFGALFFPVLSLRFILTGASGMLFPTLDWLEDNGRIDSARHAAVIEDLNALSGIQFSRTEARHLLFKLIRKTMQGMATSVINMPGNIVRFFKGLGSR